METSVKDVFDSVIIRFGGELWIKKTWTRRLYQRRLVENIKNVLKHYEVPYSEIVRRHGRLFLRTDSAVEAARRLARIFGISSVSPSLETSSKLEDIVDRNVFLAGHLLKEGNSFAVKCRRVGDQTYSSADVCRVVGQRILDEFGEKLGLKVDLDRPDVKLGVEARNDEAFVYSDIIDGAGGMPLGTQPRVVGLLSGGIDSAVACWLVMKRGCPVVPVYFDNTPFTDATTTERALNVAEALFDWAVGFPRRVYVVQHGENLKKIVENCSRKFTCLLCKRMMYRIAERLTDLIGAEGIVTGEAIGEQASQTITNLRVLSNAVQKYPIHRPLLGFDKAETETIARKIGTYKISSRKAGGCAAVPSKPATRAKLKEVMEAEEKLNIEKMVERSIESLKVVKV
ncbi:MAG: tRNA 4-thiouridine(8) synthase ThiI [Candidatus Bathyarchaeota archaeon]|nr:tRNA 4-thiouridine(8) synthase ThiI [Candidatus Bathyarchaeota archaeon]MDH5622945.1 tRNA 4-thiouridine(8) synthase ThiI [Candidatus Bathyarchaeota archaeon]MDH5635056.1 tRNA 4-thiouridine(8) synthase ThiI [Candidatus Bathyarchaeota archaeon]MDH5701689.1 tRNA 4-thiouridine(8) synthase ThiI [Candidatus Bathyarchaeota archaeon]